MDALHRSGSRSDPDPGRERTKPRARRRAAVRVLARSRDPLLLDRDRAGPADEGVPVLQPTLRMVCRGWWRRDGRDRRAVDLGGVDEAGLTAPPAGQPADATDLRPARPVFRAAKRAAARTG